MAKLLAVLLVSFVFSGLTEGKPAPVLQSFVKDAANTESAQEIPGEPSEVISVDDCSQFCSQTYPQHTYPIPSHHKACTTGCRSAQVDALIKWPFFPSEDHCTSACNEAYPSDGELQYACGTGCTVTTIDSLFPDREIIYGEMNMNKSDCEMSDTAPLEEIGDWMSSFADNFFDPFPFDADVKKLSDHANLMSQLLPPVKSSVITYVFDDDSPVEVKEYNFDGGFMVEEPMIDVFDLVDIPLFDDDIVEPSFLANLESERSETTSSGVDVSESLDSVYVYHDSPTSLGRYKWFLTGGALLVLGIAILSLSLLFGLRVFNKDSDHSESKRKKVATTFVQSHTPSVVKVPLDGGSEFGPGHSHVMVPVHIKVGRDKGVVPVVA